MKLPDAWSRAAAKFDDANLVSFAGLAPLLALAERAGLSELIGQKVRIDPEAVKVESAGVNPAGKLISIIAGMACGADSIDDLEVIRSGGMKQLFGGVYAAATLGQFLREFTHGHTLQLAAVLRAHLVNLVPITGLLPGLRERAFIDIDSLLRPVFGHAKQGASMVSEAIRTARAAGASGEILLRGDSAYGTSAVVNACTRAGARFSVVLIRNPSVAAAIATIADEAWTPVHYPGAVVDPDTGELISDAEVAEIQFTAFASTKTPVTARLIVRRVRDRAKLDELFPVWRHHPFLTNNTEPTAQADITHRQHAIIETVFSDLIDGPLAHLPSGQFASNSAWGICAAIMHNLLRAAGTIAGGTHAVARGATLRRHLIAVPARLARPQRRPVLHLPMHWPWAEHWISLWHKVFDTGPPATA